MKKYNLHLIGFKNLKRGDKTKRVITNIDYYGSIAFDLAKFLAYKKGDCLLRFYNKKGEPCYSSDAFSAIGYSDYRQVVAIIKPVQKFPTSKDNISLYLEVKNHVSLNQGIVNWEKLNPLIESYKDNFYDYSMECAYIWGPENSIPKGYDHVKEGLIQNGDYYFECGWDYWCWISVDVSFASAKMGTKIETT